MNEEHRQIGKSGGDAGKGNPEEPFPWGHPAGARLIPVRAGVLRANRPALNARTDCEAVCTWLEQARRRSTKTYDAYRREAERLLFWAAHRDKALSQVVREDILAYYGFLATVPNDSPLVAARVWRRSDSRWRPFTKPLSDNARRNAQLILSSLYQYLTGNGWFGANPQPPARIRSGYTPKPLASCLNGVQTDAVVAFLHQQELVARTAWERMNAVRDRWIVAVLVHLALEVGIGSRARMSDFRSARRGDQTVWHLRVWARGRAGAAIPVTEACLKELMKFRQAIGLAALPPQHDSFPLIPDFRKVWETDASSVEGLACRAASTQTIYRRVKWVFQGAAHLLMERAFYEEAETLKSAHPRWLRHTSIRDFVACVSDLTLAQKFARHSHCGLTALYAAPTNHDSHRELSKRRPYK